MDAIERLRQMLDAKDAELDEAREQTQKLEWQLEGILGGWKRHRPVDDDPRLPLPRLEIIYEQRDGWREYVAIYRLVMQHLVDGIYAIPIGQTKVGGGGEPTGPPLPFRDGAHIIHDAAHLRLPAFEIIPGQEPKRIDLSERLTELGVQHRRVGTV